HDVISVKGDSDISILRSLQENMSAFRDSTSPERAPILCEFPFGNWHTHPATLSESHQIQNFRQNCCSAPTTLPESKLTVTN
ncbi:MAG: hypothetical protein RRZ65_09260, partial [Tannerellaceae bacterium]